jgi:hypothetical protein
LAFAAKASSKIFTAGFTSINSGPSTKKLFPSPAPHSLGNLVFRKVDQERIAVSVAVLINDLAVA